MSSKKYSIPVRFRPSFQLQKEDQKINGSVCARQNWPNSREQTKDWRHRQLWWRGGKHSECDKKQKELVREITGLSWTTDHYRFHEPTLRLIKIFRAEPKDKFDYTEDFDLNTKYRNKECYCNLKLVCESGGAQTRSLKCVYGMMINQLEYTKDNNHPHTYFFNIIEGDQGSAHRECFEQLVSRYPGQAQVFVGDMREFESRWSVLFGTGH
jgi:hypothetical protein